MIRISQTAVEIAEDQFAQFRFDFRESGCVRLPGLVSQPLLALLMKQTISARFFPKNEAENGRVFGRTLFVPFDDPLWFSFVFMMNHPELFRIVERITETSGLRNFIGRVHRTIAGESQGIDWHDDAVENRCVGLAVSLEDEKYSGGLFQIRGPDLKLRAELGQTPAGSGFLFRIGKGWSHRLTEVTKGRRTIGVGWFRSAPDREEYINELFEHQTGSRVI